MKKLQPEIFEGENVGNASQELTKATELKKIFAQLFLIAINFFVVEKKLCAFEMRKREKENIATE
jgi:hypothetical protein